MTKSSVQNSAYVFQFDNGSYLSLHEGKARYTFSVTSMFINAEMFESIHDVPEWITTYLGGKLVHVTLEVMDE